jgi:hypothetical protein
MKYESPVAGNAGLRLLSGDVTETGNVLSIERINFVNAVFSHDRRNVAVNKIYPFSLVELHRPSDQRAVDYLQSGRGENPADEGGNGDIGQFVVRLENPDDLGNVSQDFRFRIQVILR